MEEYAHDFTRQQGITISIELVSLDTRDGASMASLYDVVQYPAIVVTAENGSILKFWQGPDETPPLMTELAAYARG